MKTICLGTQFSIFTFFLIAVLGTILISGCIQEQVVKPTISVQVPTIKLEATVISLSLDTNIECEEKCPGSEYPRDTGVIRIDRIISVENPNNWDLDEIKEGNEITIEFDYSARPAKIRIVPVPKENDPASSETPISHVPTFANPIPKEDGYFVYVIESPLVAEESETILPGLDVGLKFTGTIGYSSPTKISIGKYEIIP
jgi:outer membrane murein-binding lipoprotein Lpp